MPKILIADDNSNIQRMVALALKDQGIDVVAVGNGEAAVRKISELRPDLVLADVFMPVRNGYEVCEYVKKDPSLAHIPVILLVGVFDPLDEQEAQRVGSDGVLKKPFVPPEPLIAMVKSALASRTSAAAVQEKSGASSLNGVPAGTSKADRRLSTLAAKSGKSALAEEAEPYSEDIPARPAALKIEAGRQPLAFSSLLEMPETEEDPELLPAEHPELSTERDWRSADAEGKSAKEKSLVDEMSGPVHDWRDTSFEKVGLRTSSSEVWAPSSEKRDLAELAEAPSALAAPSSPLTDDLRPAPIAEDRQQETAAAASMEVPEPPAKEFEAVFEARESDVHASVASAKPAPAQEIPAESEKPPPANSWLSIGASPWNTEPKTANELASAWDVPAAPVKTATAQPAASVPEASAETASPAVPMEETTAPEPERLASAGSEAGLPVAARVLLPSKAVEVIREEASQAVESVIGETHRAIEIPAGTPSDTDALVARVLARMTPEMLQAVTREILKPVVEAMIRSELEARKP